MERSLGCRSGSCCSTVRVRGVVVQESGYAPAWLAFPCEPGLDALNPGVQDNPRTAMEMHVPDTEIHGKEELNTGIGACSAGCRKLNAPCFFCGLKVEIKCSVCGFEICEDCI